MKGYWLYQWPFLICNSIDFNHSRRIIRFNTMENRRKFLQSALAGLAGTATFPLQAFFERPSLPSLDHFSNDEDYWESIKKQFTFNEGLYYFNHASLGSSPDAVRKATAEFMETLEKFPSWYMWGGWEQEKESVRQKVADLFGVSNEEIAQNRRIYHH